MEQIKPDKRYIIAEEENLVLNIRLDSNFNDLNEYNNTRVISLSELFTKERNESIKYRIYGNINYFSFLRNKKQNPSDIVDMFNDDSTFGFNLEDFFDIKLFRAITQQSYYNQTNNYIEKLSAITNTNDCKLNFFGYSKNAYKEKNYSFKFNTLKLDPNELVRIGNNFIYNNSVYLGFIPKQSVNYTLYEKIVDKNEFISELNSATTYGYVETAFTTNIDQITNSINTNSNFTNAEFKTYFTDKLKNFFKIYNLNVGLDNLNKNLSFIRNYLDIGNSDYKTKILLDLNQTVFSGGFINFNRINYSFNEIIKKEYIIKLPLIDEFIGGNNDYIKWKNDNGYTAFTISESNIVIINNLGLNLGPLLKYTVIIDFYFKFNPFYKIELKKYDSVIDEIYSGISTTLIPPQTAIITDNKIIWKDLLTYGDPDNYDNPFINDSHYFFNDINFYLKPDISDKNTFILMNDFRINFTNNNFKFNRDSINLVPKQSKDIC